MLNNFFLTSLIALSCSAALSISTADADRAARAPVPGPAVSKACLVTTEATTPVFQIERKTDYQIKDYVESNLVIVSNGAWTYTETKNGKVSRTEAGCLTKADLATLTTALASATWKTSRAELRCMAEPIDFTRFSVNGKLVLTSRMCDGLLLDAATQKAMATATAITNKLPTK